jgi:signal transduction histidine kinase/ActR/RegA family two-component response regulator
MRDSSTVALKPRELSELVRGPAFVVDEQGRVLGCNRAAAAALGTEPERVEGGRLADVLADGGPPPAELAAAMAPGGAGPWPARLRTARGPVGCQLRAVVPAAGRRCLLVTVEADGEPVAEIAQLRAALEIVRSLLDRFGARLFPLDQGLLLVGPDGRIEHATHGTSDMLGLPIAQLLETPVAEVAAQLDLRGLDTLPEPGEETTTCTLRRPDGRERILRHRAVPLMADDGSPLGTLHAFYDATATIERTHELAEKSRELDEARARLTRAQHLKALGQLAAEVAHEFGNLLQAIGLQAAALRRSPMLPEPVMRSLWSIKQAVDIGQALTRRLLTFARDDPNERMEPFDVGRVLRDLVQLLEPRLNKGGRPLRVELSLPQLPDVMGSQNKLTEAFLNLFLNALDAMPDGGTLQVSATESSGEIRIAVRDSGKGMTREELARAFDPFFTTKPGGTGLGLSTVYGVVRSHGGSVFLESEPAKGTTVFVSLPTAYPPTAVMRPTALGRALCEAWRVLVVDDHPTVREATSELLAAQGYEVESAGNVADALTAIEAQRFTVVVTDVGLPDRPGWEVARAAKQRSRDTVVVLVSGWGSHFSAEEARARGVDLVFEKPVDPDVLLSAIAREIEHSTAA